MTSDSDEVEEYIQTKNSQYLVGKNIRSLIYDSTYWKEECVALTEELLLNKAKELTFIGGVSGEDSEPTPFLCLTLRMLQIQPRKSIVDEFIRDEQFKYVRALGAFYMRLTGSPLERCKNLVPLYNDTRVLSRKNRHAKFELVHMNNFVGELLECERVCSVILPCVRKQNIPDDTGTIEVCAPEEDMKGKGKRKWDPSPDDCSSKIRYRKTQRRHPDKKTWRKKHVAPVQINEKLNE